MEWTIAAAAGIGGYLIGAVSFARIVAGRVKPGESVEETYFVTPDGEGRVRYTGVGGTMVKERVGPRWGFVAGFLDMLKALVPTFALHLAYPGQPYFLVASAAVVLGHNWPVYYRFRGGMGQASIIGSMLVIDPLGVLVTHVTGLVVGNLIPRIPVTAPVSVGLLIPWLWWRTDGDVAHVVWATAVTVLYITASASELRQFTRLGIEGHIRTREDAATTFRVADWWRRGS